MMGFAATLELCIFTILSTGIIQVLCACHNRYVGYRTELMNCVQNQALTGHTFSSVTSFNEPQKCFFACASDCRCMSYNFQTQPSSDGSQLCELNSADSVTQPTALKHRPGFSYYDILPIFASLETDATDQQCAQTCSTKCCESFPCQNGGQCHEIYGQKKRLWCNCTEGFTGDLCNFKAKSCLDYFRFNRSSVAGFYSVQDEEDVDYIVFCDFDKEGIFAWTMVMSYELANNDNFKDKPFSTSHPMNENLPNFDSYRLSKARMLSVQDQSSHWRATCNYNTDGVVFTDYVRSSFVNVDPMTLNEKGCKKMEYVNIRGSSCEKCTVRVAQRSKWTFRLTSYSGEYKSSLEKCSFVNAAGHVYNEQNFGYYQYINTAHRCSESNVSTTQFWFGARIET